MRLPPGRFQRTIRNSLTSVEPSHLGIALRRCGERTQNALDRFTKRTPRTVFRLDHHSYSPACSCGEERQAAWQYAHTCLLPRLASKPETRGTERSWGNAHSTQYSGTQTRYSYATQGRNSATVGTLERYSLTPSEGSANHSEQRLSGQFHTTQTVDNSDADTIFADPAGARCRGALEGELDQHERLFSCLFALCSEQSPL